MYSCSLGSQSRIHILLVMNWHFYTSISHELKYWMGKWNFSSVCKNNGNIQHESWRVMCFQLNVRKFHVAYTACCHCAYLLPGDGVSMLFCGRVYWHQCCDFIHKLYHMIAESLSSWCGGVWWRWSIWGSYSWGGIVVLMHEFWCATWQTLWLFGAWRYYYKMIVWCKESHYDSR